MTICTYPLINFFGWLPPLKSKLCWPRFCFQSHMNKDHADDTKLIVQHSTSVPVIFQFISWLFLPIHTRKCGFKIFCSNLFMELDWYRLFSCISCKQDRECKYAFLTPCSFLAYRYFSWIDCIIIFMSIILLVSCINTVICNAINESSHIVLYMTLCAMDDINVIRSLNLIQCFVA